MPEDKESPYLHIVKTAHYFERFWPPASRFEQLSYTIKKTPHKEVLFLLVMRFPVIANWSNLPQTFACKRFEEGIGFCESTDFLLEALSSLLELA